MHSGTNDDDDDTVMLAPPNQPPAPPAPLATFTPLLYRDSWQCIFRFLDARDFATAFRVCFAWRVTHVAELQARRVEKKRIRLRLAQLAEGLWSNDERLQCVMAEDLRRFINRVIHERNGMHVSVIDEVHATPGLVLRVVTLLCTTSHSTIPNDLTWIAINLTAGTHAQMRLLATTGMFAALKTRLQVSAPEVLLTQTIWALGNICHSLPNEVIGSMPTILQIAHQFADSDPIIEQVCFFIANAFRSRNHVSTYCFAALPLCVQWTTMHRNALIRMRAAKIIQFLTDYPNNDTFTDALLAVRPDVLVRWVDYLRNVSSATYPGINRLMRVMRNVAVGSNVHTQAVFDAGIVTILHRYVQHEVVSLREDSYVIIAACLTGTAAMRAAMWASGLLQWCSLAVYNREPSSFVRIEIGWVVSKLLWKIEEDLAGQSTMIREEMNGWRIMEVLVRCVDEPSVPLDILHSILAGITKWMAYAVALDPVNHTPAVLREARERLDASLARRDVVSLELAELIANMLVAIDSASASASARECACARTPRGD